MNILMRFTIIPRAYTLSVHIHGCTCTNARGGCCCHLRSKQSPHTPFVSSSDVLKAHARTMYIGSRYMVRVHTCIYTSCVYMFMFLFMFLIGHNDVYIIKYVALSRSHVYTPCTFLHANFAC